MGTDGLQGVGTYVRMGQGRSSYSRSKVGTQTRARVLLDRAVARSILGVPQHACCDERQAVADTNYYEN
eukprot:1476467-Amphidinium_carterae.1